MTQISWKKRRTARSFKNSSWTQGLWEDSKSSCRNSTITVNSDHVAKKFLIKLPKYSKRNFKLCANFKILLGGHYNSKYNQTKYYLTTELYGENSNTIASQLHYVIKDLMKQEVSEVYFILDNHSTNKNIFGGVCLLGFFG